MNSTSSLFVVGASALLIAIFSIACSTASANHGDEASPAATEVSTTQDTSGAVLGVRTERHLEMALLTARQVIDGNHGYKADHFVAVVCGPAVQSLTENTDLADTISALPSDRVEIKACELTMEQLDIDADELPPSVGIVPNGLIEMMRLQKIGYQSVEL